MLKTMYYFTCACGYEMSVLDTDRHSAEDFLKTDGWTFAEDGKCYKCSKRDQEVAEESKSE